MGNQIAKRGARRRSSPFIDAEHTPRAPPRGPGEPGRAPALGPRAGSSRIEWVAVSRPRLLLVDDDPDVRLIAEVSLEDRFEVVSVTSAEELLARVEELAPDVVLLDVMLPGDDGPTALRKLRERMEAPPPVVFLTARVLPDELSRWTSLGALGIIRKPFDPLSLPTEVLRLLDAREEPAP
ncbi:MAG: hypothetical protein CMN31_04820 [Sandaracinus sp.]|nr:hypothetical protein [Sandaracinus sp.]MBJ70653.1 hypothetical protein [Sandaracinus sp.]